MYLVLSMHFPLVCECMYKNSSRLSNDFYIIWGIRKIIAKNQTKLLGFIHINMKPVFITKENIPQTQHRFYIPHC